MPRALPFRLGVALSLTWMALTFAGGGYVTVVVADALIQAEMPPVVVLPSALLTMAFCLALGAVVGIRIERATAPANLITPSQEHQP